MLLPAQFDVSEVGEERESIIFQKGVFGNFGEGVGLGKKKEKIVLIFS